MGLKKYSKNTIKFSYKDVSKRVYMSSKNCLKKLPYLQKVFSVPVSLFRQ